MARKVINIGTNSYRRGADSLPVAFNEVNDNFEELYGSATFDALLEQKGAVFNGTTDDSAAIQAAIDVYTATARGRIVFPPGSATKILTGLTLKAGLVSIDFNGAYIDASGMTTGYAISILPNDVSPYSIYARANPISNFMLFGSSSESNVTDGIFIGSLGGSGDVTGVAMYNFSVSGFRDGMFLGDQCFINAFYSPVLEDCYRRGLNYTAATVAGEAVNFVAGRISDCHKSDNSAVAIYMPNSDAGSNELQLHGTSLDYNDKAWDIAAGILNLHGCHIEDNHKTNSLGDIVHNSGDTPAGVYISGGEIGITDSDATRSILFNVGGSKAFFIARTLFNLYDKAAEIVHVTSSTPHIDISGSHVDFAGSTSYPTIGSALNVLYNPGGEAGATVDGWGTSGTNYTWTGDTGVFRSGSRSIKCVSTGAANGNCRQFVACRPGQQVAFRMWFNITALSAGQVFGSIKFYTANPDSTTATQVQGNDPYSSSSTTAGWVETRGMYVAPAGTKYAEIQGSGLAFTGTFYMDDFELTVI